MIRQPTSADIEDAIDTVGVTVVEDDGSPLPSSDSKQQLARTGMAQPVRLNESTDDEVSWGTELLDRCGGPATREKYCTPKWFLITICMFVLFQSIVVTGLFSSTLSTIELRYNLSSQTMGTVAATYDFTVLAVCWIVAYYGSSVRGHTPRWLGGGFVILCFGALLYASPQFFDWSFTLDSIIDTDRCLATPLIPVCGSGTNLLFLFFLAQIVIALGASPLYTLTPAYFDEIVEKDRLGMYLGIFYAFAALGPAFGFVLGFIFLSGWVEPGNAPPGLTNDDPNWVGNWWAGYVLAACLGLVCAIPLFMFPKFLPKTRHVREGNKLEAAMLRRRMSYLVKPPEEPRLIPSLVALAVNPTYMFNILGQSTEAFTVAGFSAFLPKAVQSIFGLSSSTAALSVGLVIIPGAAGGIFTGGWLIKRWKLTPVQTARVAVFAAAISLVFMFGFFLGCDTVKLAGITREYPDASSVSNPAWRGGLSGAQNLTSSCNLGCFNCDPDDYQPVCGSDGLNYFSGCYAGCNNTGTRVDPTFVDCSCVGGTTQTATKGRCDNGCGTLPGFLFILFLIMFFTFMNNVPATSVILRATQPEHRSLAMGVQNAAFRLIGTVPGPIVFGAIIDTTCKLHETDCGSQTDSCLEYSNDTLALAMVFLAVIPKMLSLISFFLSWWFFRQVEVPSALSPRADEDDTKRPEIHRRDSESGAAVELEKPRQDQDQGDNDDDDE